MFKEWLKQFIALCICVIIVLSSFTNAFAEDYVADDDDDDNEYSTYYIVSGEDVDDLFDFTLGDIPDILAWIKNFKTYTVIKRIGDSGDCEYRYYFNTPNLQTIVKNKVTSMVSDGFQDATYDVNDLEWLVDVGRPNGANDLNESAITKYGFAIDSPTYMGEYPKEVMSVAGIVPTSGWDAVWRTIKTLVTGVSFLKAPSSSNFNTITYINHGYEDKDAYIVDFFRKYYLPYFERKIANDESLDGYFTGPEEVVSETVTSKQNSEAELYMMEHSVEYFNCKDKKTVCEIVESNKDSQITDEYKFWKTIYRQNGVYRIDEKAKEKGVSTSTLYGKELLKYYGSVLEYLISTDETYKEKFITWANNNKRACYALAYIGCGDSKMSFPFKGVEADSINITDANYVETAVLCNKAIENFDLSDVSILDGGTYVSVPDACDEGLITTSNNGSLTYYLNDSYKTEISISSLRAFITSAYIGNKAVITFDESVFIKPDELALIGTYERSGDIIKDYLSFQTKMEMGSDSTSIFTKKEILYKQCMIENEGEDGECKSTKYGGEETSLTIANVYAYSGIYKITEGYSDTDTELKEADVYKILNKLQSYLGPYYSMVLSNMIKLMCGTAFADGDIEPFLQMQQDDPRIMPYDVGNLTGDDKENYDCADPRVTIYKEHIIGGLISDFELNFGIKIFFKPQKAIINLGGKITEISVFMQQLMSFDKFDEWGLSPTNLWDNAYVGLLMSMIALYFIIRTVMAIIKKGNDKRNITEIIISFLILVFELGLFTYMAIAPDRVWNTVKKADTFVISLGERLSPSFNDEDLHYLFGDNEDVTVMYYLPYLDIWSKYNTGYGLKAPEQLMWQPSDGGECPPELVNYYDDDNTNPIKIGGNNIRHYSVLLMDSFGYYGESKSVVNSVLEIGNDGELHSYNGNSINNNAYRVVDHFMAPRVSVTEKSAGSKLELNVTENENYNGEFQNGWDLFVKLLTCCLMCFLSFIKFMTFLWQWFMFYIFIFKVVLGKGPENKTWGKILCETFAPTLALVFLGMYSGVILEICMSDDLTKLVGCVVILGLFWLTFLIIKLWKNKFEDFYPKTLNWLYMLLNMKEHSRNTKSKELDDEFDRDMKERGIANEKDEDGNDVNNYSFAGKTRNLFDEQGRIRENKLDVNGRDKDLLEKWYSQAKIRERNGQQFTDYERNAIRTFEQDDRFKDFRNSYKLPGEHDKLKRYNKFTTNDSNNKISNNKDSTNTNKSNKEDNNKSSKGGDA